LIIRPDASLRPLSAPTIPLLLRWQGSLQHAPSGALGRRLTLVAGLVLCALMAGLPLVTRSGLSLLVLASGLLWLLIALRTPPGPLGEIDRWILAILALALLATGFSPVPLAAAKGLVKLVSYLGVYALMRQLLSTAPIWWDRIVAALLAGELVTSVIGIRQLYADTGWPAGPTPIRWRMARCGSTAPWKTPTCWRDTSYPCCRWPWWACCAGPGWPASCLP
jgi:putative inorganic carbon (HCO3(-)) transporter